MSNSIIDVLNESIQNFKITRARNKSSRPSPGGLNKNSSQKKLNSSYNNLENNSHKEPSRPTSNQGIRSSIKTANNKESSKLINLKFHYKYGSGESLYDPEVARPMSPENYEKTASFVIEKSDSPDPEISELLKEITELKEGQKSLETQVLALESKLLQSFKDPEQPRQIDFSTIMNRIGGLQEKFSNRSKTPFSTEKISDLFEKINRLELEAERIKRENNEVESLYHQSLNEIYEKIEKLKSENKALTEIILASSVGTSPKHFENKEFNRKISYGSPQKEPLYTEVSLKRAFSEEKNDDYTEQLYKQKEIIELEQLKIEKELKDIPANSKSMANKKKKQGLETEYQENQLKLDQILEKISKI
jgi:hypothetical protein